MTEWRSWMDAPPDPLEILAFGYVREHLSIFQLEITFPDDVKKLIFEFYPKQCKVYGIGANNYNELGLIGNVSQFHELEAFGKLSIQPQDIYQGYSRFTVKTHEDRIYSIGNNWNGACGCGQDDTQIEQLREVQMTHIERYKPDDQKINFIRCVSSGTNHMLFVLNDVIYATGQNEYGQCNGTQSDIKTQSILYEPFPIDRTFNTENNRIIQIQCGYNHSILLNENGKIYGVGSNAEYQCGIDSEEKVFKTMQEIQCGVRFIDVSVGGFHALCISRENQLYIFGKNTSHELGVYATNASQVYEKNEYYHTPTLHPYFAINNKRIIFTSTKHEHSMAIDTDHICYLFGANNANQVSKRKTDQIDDVVIFQKEYREFRKWKIQSGSCGYNHTLLLDLKDNQVIGFGGNEYRQTNPLSTRKHTKDPHTFNSMEVGIKFEERIVRVLAGEFTTVLIQHELNKTL